MFTWSKSILQKELQLSLSFNVLQKMSMCQQNLFLLNIKSILMNMEKILRTEIMIFIHKQLRIAYNLRNMNS